MMKRVFFIFMLIPLFIFPVETGASETRPSGAKTPDIEAKGAILIDFESGRVLWAKNADEPMAMASTTKIMTGIMALEMGNLADTVTVSRRAAEAPKVKMYLQAGEKITLEVLLYALMLQSSNDAAVAIAEHLGGTVEDFCLLMTEKAAALGAKDTVFETPNGLDMGNHHSTAYDMAVIARYALRNPDFMNIINTRFYVGKSDRNEYHITNRNRFLSEFEGANGVKTGYTGKAGYCFVGSAKRDELWLISVVLASGWGSRGREQKWTDTKQILRFGFNNYDVETVVVEGDAAKTVTVERSKTPCVSTVYSETLRLPLNADEKENVRLEARVPSTLRAPILVGDKLGVCDVYIGGEKYTEIDILAASGADRHDLKTSMEKTLQILLQIVTKEDVHVILPEF